MEQDFYRLCLKTGKMFAFSGAWESVRKEQFDIYKRSRYVFNLDWRTYKSKDLGVIQGHFSRVTTIITFKTALLAWLSRGKTSAGEKHWLPTAVVSLKSLTSSVLANVATQADISFAISHLQIIIIFQRNWPVSITLGSKNINISNHIGSSKPADIWRSCYGPACLFHIHHC